VPGGFAEPLPRIVCRRASLPALSADTELSFWHEREPEWLRDVVTGAAPQQATSVRVAWDADEIRVLFCAEDAHIHATLAERDAPLYTEEVVEVFLDPVGDRECYFEVEVNPLNAVLDLVLRRNRSGYAKDASWTCEGLRTCVRREAASWSAELSIPFRSLAAAPPESGATWRANFLRIDRPPGVPRELSAWSPTGLANFHVPERFGAIEFAVSAASPE
jgi:hypothetical protein